MKRNHKESCRRFKFIILTLLILLFTTLSFPVYSGGTVIIIGGSNFDNHHFSGHGRAHRLHNKHFFDNRHRRGHDDRHYRNRHFRSNYYGDRSYSRKRYYGYDTSGYNYRRGYRNSDRYCPY